MCFGFFYGKNTSLKAEQAKAFKEQLIEMNSSPEDLSKIAGSSVEMGFQRISLTSDELKPFDYFQFDQKQICNILGYSDKLLNNDQGAKYDNIKEVKKEMITDDIAPDLKLFEEAFNKRILPKFKGYDKACIVFDYNELPEMQGDVVEMSSWLKDALDRGVISRNEYRVAIRYSKADNTDLDVFTVSTDIIPLDEALNNDFSIE